jgi:hypothetical protein
VHAQSGGKRARQDSPSQDVQTTCGQRAWQERAHGPTTPIPDIKDLKKTSAAVRDSAVKHTRRKRALEHQVSSLIIRRHLSACFPTLPDAINGSHRTANRPLAAHTHGWPSAQFGISSKPTQLTDTLRTLRMLCAEQRAMCRCSTTAHPTPSRALGIDHLKWRCQSHCIASAGERSLPAARQSAACSARCDARSRGLACSLIERSRDIAHATLLCAQL